MGQVPSYLAAETRQEVKEEGGRGDTVHVVVPEYGDGLTGTEGLLDAHEGPLEVGKLMRVGKVLEPAGKNMARLGWFDDAAGRQDASHRGRNPERRGEGGRRGGVSASDPPTEAAALDGLTP
jgi:hypothetical protein